MQGPKKNIRTSRSRDDYDLFKVAFISYSPEAIEGLTISLKPGDYLSPDHPLGRVAYRRAPVQGGSELQGAEEGSVGETLSTNLAGTVQRMGSCLEEGEEGWRVRQGQKRGPLELLWVRQCEHPVPNQSMENTNNKVNFNLPAGQICPLCRKQIWIYTSRSQEAVTAEDLINRNYSLQLQALAELQWSIIRNEQFTPTTAIARISDLQINYPVLAKATYLIGEGERIEHKTVVMTIKRIFCRHEKVYEQRCQYCMQHIDMAEALGYCRYLFQMGPSRTEHSLMKGAALAHQQEAYLAELLQKNKLILILDLDNTILHSTQMSDLGLGQLLKLRQFFMVQKFDQDAEGKVRMDYLLIKMRPFTQEFLFVVSRLFQVYIYTKGTRVYADQICRWVRAQWAGNELPCFSTWSQPPLTFLKDTECFLPYRVVSRNEDSSEDTKSMQNILPNRMEYHVILDDRRDVWSNSPSWHFTREYLFYRKRPQSAQTIVEEADQLLAPDNEAPPFKDDLIQCYNKMRESYPQKNNMSVQFFDKTDYFLLFTAHSFKKMHSYFFELLKKNEETKVDSPGRRKQVKPHPVSLANIMYRLKLFFSKKKLRFFMAGDNHTVRAISVVRRAHKMGAKILDSKSSQTPDYVIRGNRYIHFVKEHGSDERFNLEYEALKDSESAKALTKPAVMKNQQDNSKVKSQEGSVNAPIEGLNLPKNAKEAMLNKTASLLKQKVMKQLGLESSRQTYQSELQQFKSMVEKGVPIISQTFITACYEYSYRFRSEDFRLGDPLKEDVKSSDFNEVIVKAAERIRKEINDQMVREGALPGDSKGRQQKEIEISGEREGSNRGLKKESKEANS